MGKAPCGRKITPCFDETWTFSGVQKEIPSLPKLFSSALLSLYFQILVAQTMRTRYIVSCIYVYNLGIPSCKEWQRCINLELTVLCKSQSSTDFREFLEIVNDRNMINFKNPKQNPLTLKLSLDSNIVGIIRPKLPPNSGKAGAAGLKEKRVALPTKLAYWHGKEGNRKETSNLGGIVLCNFQGKFRPFLETVSGFPYIHHI